MGMATCKRNCWNWSCFCCIFFGCADRVKFEDEHELTVKRPPSKEEVASVTIQAGFRAMKAREEATRRRYSRDDDDNAVAKVVKDEIGEDEDNAAAKATSG
uniref:Uncharacterized protein n=1 Tax=Vitrella brassicaformis TaxID=1169539 RepID=A0A6U4J392_9ALVE|mmetsp:Transcript_6546/g.15830  ORF Transcript_6546/g.15830 Transcript_6546/m.15830 type:complete len:101 (+) Transcript_6546:484-786(+)